MKEKILELIEKYEEIALNDRYNFRIYYKVIDDLKEIVGGGIEMKEDIKEIEIIITTIRTILQKEIKDTTEDVYKIDGRQFRAIENLLTSYKELEVKNEEWQRAYQEEKEKQFKLLRENEELEKENEKLTYARNWYFEHFTARELTPEQLDKILRFDYIPTSLVEKKIEEYEKQRIKMEKDDVGVGFTLGKEWSDLKAKIEVLQELLRRRGEIRSLIFTICQERRKWFL